jgi:hypothetical protein
MREKATSGRCKFAKQFLPELRESQQVCRIYEKRFGPRFGETNLRWMAYDRSLNALLNLVTTPHWGKGLLPPFPFPFYAFLMKASDEPK